MTIGYDIENKCLTVKKTPSNTSFETMFNICVDEIIRGNEIEKYKTILLNVAKYLDKEGK